ncbi:MAG: hypothetical protein ACI9R3_006558 [Verrucomicrobiales bacterium]|jgi:hypothetical protein
MALLRTESGLDWKIWFVGFAIIALIAAFISNRSMEAAPQTELATDNVKQSVHSHTNKNRQAADALSSIVDRK